MASSLSARSVIAPLLLLGLLAGCDRQSPRQEQPAANAAAPVAEAPPAPPPAAGTIDRGHKGEAAITVPFLDASGKRTTLAAFKGKPVLVNLWATWCGPCVTEMPTLDKAAGTIALVAINQDSGKEGQAKAATFLLAKGFRNIRLFTDPDTTISTALNATLPMTILYDSAGREVWRTTGGMDWTTPQAKALLAEAV